MISAYSFVPKKSKEKSSFHDLSLQNATNQYLIQPKNTAYLIVRSKQEKNYLVSGKWGMIPRSAKNNMNCNTLYNVYATGIFSKTSSRLPIRENRCIIPMDGYYIISKDSNKVKRICTNKNETLFAAGIYEIFLDNNGKKTISYSIIISAAHRDIDHIHSVMPVFLDEEKANTFLESSTPIHEIDVLLRGQFAKGYFDAYGVDPKYMQNPSADLHKPLEPQYLLFD